MSLFNTIGLKEEVLIKENILKYISEYDVYNYYLPGIKIGKVYKSPFRSDKQASFGIFIGFDGELAFNDYRLGGGDFIKFVTWIEQCSYIDALNHINNIFDLKFLPRGGVNRIYIKPALISKYKPKAKHKPKIYIKSREWNSIDAEYWYPLIESDVKPANPIKYFWIDKQLFGTAPLAYSYKYGKNVYKIYQPTKDRKEGKWWSNISASTPWFGHNNLPDTGDYLFVASSNKDALVLIALGYNAIAPHSESQTFTPEQHAEYSFRFKNIVVFFDNDTTGILKAYRFNDLYGTTSLFLEEKDTKDPFEFIKKYTLLDLRDYIEQELKIEEKRKIL